LGFIKLPRVLRDIEVALLTDKQVHQHKSFRLGIEHALCRNRGGEVVDLAQKTFCEFTIADDESHFQGSRASLVCDLPLAAFSKQIQSKTRLHPRYIPGTVPRYSIAKHAYIPRDCPQVFISC
jgi:hypothetical protein